MSKYYGLLFPFEYPTVDINKDTFEFNQNVELINNFINDPNIDFSPINTVNNNIKKMLLVCILCDASLVSCYNIVWNLDGPLNNISSSMWHYDIYSIGKHTEKIG